MYNICVGYILNNSKDTAMEILASMFLVQNPVLPSTSLQIKSFDYCCLSEREKSFTHTLSLVYVVIFIQSSFLSSVVTV